MADEIKKQKQAQITVFVIIAIILIASVALVFVFKSSKFGLTSGGTPKNQIEKCINDAGLEAIQKISAKGGLGVVNAERSIRYDNINVTYLCYTKQYEELCINEHPMLKQEMEKEIASLIKPKIESCLANIKSRLEGYSEEKTSGEWINVAIVPKNVIISLNKKISYDSAGNRVSLENIRTEIIYPLYEFTTFANEIINQELNCNCEEESCNADTTLLSMYEKDFEFTKPINNQNGEVYVLREFLTGKSFKFAIRNCIGRVVG